MFALAIGVGLRGRETQDSVWVPRSSREGDPSPLPGGLCPSQNASGQGNPTVNPRAGSQKNNSPFFFFKV